MTRFIPRDKLSKKARRKLDNQQRRKWPFPPGIRTIEGKKNKRHRKPHDYQEEWNRGIFDVVY